MSNDILAKEQAQRCINMVLEILISTKFHPSEFDNATECINFFSAMGSTITSDLEEEFDESKPNEVV